MLEASHTINVWKSPLKSHLAKNGGLEIGSGVNKVASVRGELSLNLYTDLDIS